MNNHHEFTLLDLTDYGHNLAKEHIETIKFACKSDIILSRIGRPSATLYSTDPHVISAFEDIIGHNNVIGYEIIGYANNP